VFPTLNSQIDDWAPDEPRAMLVAFAWVLGDFRPDVLLTCGGHPAARDMMLLAIDRRIPVVFGLHNFAYAPEAKGDRHRLPERPEGCCAQTVPVPFCDVDYVIVPSEFAARWYQRRLGLKCHVLPYAIDCERVSCQLSAVSGQREEVIGDQSSVIGDGSDAQLSPLNPQRASLNVRRYVTFVNPQPTKGLFVFARIAEQLQRRRPEIPILVVESRGAASALGEEKGDRFNLRERPGGCCAQIEPVPSFQVPIDLSWCQNLHAMENTHDPRDFYRATKLLLVPSLWNESFGLVAVEAMINGIPVREKWGDGRESRVEGPRPEADIEVSSGTRPSTLSPRLSLCMIARNNERTIGAALEVIRN
jgi:glycosyltransferase involved in cell wall biosynthesis